MHRNLKKSHETHERILKNTFVIFRDFRGEQYLPKALLNLNLAILDYGINRFHKVNVNRARPGASSTPYTERGIMFSR